MINLSLFHFFSIPNSLLNEKKKLYKKINCIFWKNKKNFLDFFYFLSKIKLLRLQLFLAQEEFLFLHAFMVLSCFDLKFYLNQKFGTIKNNIKISGKTLFPVQIILLIIKRLEVSFSFMFNVSCITLFFQKSCKIMQKNINFSFDTFLHSVSLSQIRYNITNYIDKYITIL